MQLTTLYAGPSISYQDRMQEADVNPRFQYYWQSILFRARSRLAGEPVPGPRAIAYLVNSPNKEVACSSIS